MPNDSTIDSAWRRLDATPPQYEDAVYFAKGAIEGQRDEDSDVVRIHEFLCVCPVWLTRHKGARQCRKDNNCEEDHERGRQQCQPDTRIHHQDN